MYNIILISFLVLTGYSFVAVIVYFISGEKEDIFTYFGMGIFGIFLLFVSNFIQFVKRKMRQHSLRSIFVEDKTGNKYICRITDTDDIHSWISGYTLQKRYATKSEWSKLPSFSEEVLTKSKINCDYCKYDRDCDFGIKSIKCKHDYTGRVTEFDQFVRNNKKKRK